VFNITCKKLFFRIGVVLVPLVSIILPVGGVLFADHDGTNVRHDGSNVNACPPGKICNPLKARTIQEFLTQLIDVVIAIGSVLAIFFLIYAGFLFVTAQGNEQKLQKAKAAFWWTVVGIAVLLGAKVIQAVIEGTVRALQ
jgi:hypothetical protein